MFLYLKLEEVPIFHYLKKGGNNPSDKNFYEQYFDQDTTFEEFVNGTIKDNKLQNISHIKPQYPFIYNIKKELKINYIGRLEEINKSIEYVQNFCPHKIQRGFSPNKPKKRLFLP